MLLIVERLQNFAWYIAQTIYVMSMYSVVLPIQMLQYALWHIIGWKLGLNIKQIFRWPELQTHAKVDWPDLKLFYFLSLFNANIFFF